MRPATSAAQLDANRRDRESDNGDGHAFHADVRREREVEDDAPMYEVSRAEELRIRDEHPGAEIHRVVLKEDLKRKYQEFLQAHSRNRPDSAGRSDRSDSEIERWARSTTCRTSTRRCTFPTYDETSSWSPRVGLIWDPFKDGRTSVRGAYGLILDPPVTNVVTPTASNPPFATPLTFAGPIRLSSAASTARAGGLAPSSVDPGFQAAQMQSWNINVERQLGANTGVMVGYFGSRGDRLRVAVTSLGYSRYKGLVRSRGSALA